VGETPYNPEDPMHDPKRATPDHPVHELIAARWSPTGFDRRPVPLSDLLALFEAARWAPSSFNEQPWRYVVANRDGVGGEAGFERLLGCLVEANQVWARHAPVLALGVASLRFERNGRTNRLAAHDLGLASAHLTFEATSRGLHVHQMAGILPDRARELYGIPADFEPLTALALGYRGSPGGLPENLRARDAAPRSRRPLGEFVFAERWGHPGP
jgi:nitroreductase